MHAPAQNGKRILVADDDRFLRHALGQMLTDAGYVVVTARDGLETAQHLRQGNFDLVFLDIWMPEMNGLEALAGMRDRRHTRVVVMTADKTPETLMQAIREQASEYLVKPFPPKEAVQVAKRLLAAPPPQRPIEVLSATPQWVELLVPCEHQAAERIQSFLTHLKADLPDEVRTAVGQAFRELLQNAIEWGGRLDPERDVRISYLRARRMLLYRISDPGGGFSFQEMEHAALSNPPDDPVRHLAVRESKGIRPGGFGILLTRALVDEVIYNEAQNEVVLIKYLEAEAAPRAQAAGVESN